MRWEVVVILSFEVVYALFYKKANKQVLQNLTIFLQICNVSLSQCTNVRLSHTFWKQYSDLMYKCQYALHTLIFYVPGLLYTVLVDIDTSTNKILLYNDIGLDIVQLDKPMHILYNKWVFIFEIFEKKSFEKSSWI